MRQTKIDIHFDHRSILQDSQSLIAYAYPKIAHACSHGRALKVVLSCSLQNGQFHQIDAVVHMPRKHVVGLSEMSRDMYTTVDLIVPKIEKVIRRYKEQMSEFRHDSACRSKRVFGDDEVS